MRSWLVAAATLLLSMVGQAATVDQSDPYKMLEQVAGKTFERLAAEKELIAQDNSHLQLVVQEELLPYVDEEYVAYSIIGRSIKDTSAQQRADFVAAFREHMLRTYSHLLEKYDGQQVHIGKGTVPQDERYVAISVVAQGVGAAPDINAVFKLRRGKSNNLWKVYDIEAENVSFLATKQSEIGELIARDGIDKVTQLLREKTARGEKL